MKKKILILFLAICSLTFIACGNKGLTLKDYIIEERQTLYTAQDDLYTASFSSGMRESNYSFDGVKNDMVEFGIICFARTDSKTMATDHYAYTLKINDQTYTGNLQQSESDSSYSADIQVCAPADATISVKIDFTGYTFNKDMANTTAEFAVDHSKALDIAGKELKQSMKNLSADKNNKMEAVMKIVKDTSTEDSHYYWYVGVVSTNGDVLGVLVDSTTGEIIAKKV